MKRVLTIIASVALVLTPLTGFAQKKGEKKWDPTDKNPAMEKQAGGTTTAPMQMKPQSVKPQNIQIQKQRKIQKRVGPGPVA